MPIPDYQAIMLPLLKLADKHDNLNMGVAETLIADEFNLTEAERRQFLPSGNQTIIKSRVGWAKTYLKKAGLLASPLRGIIEITTRGKEILASNPKVVNTSYLKQFPEFIEFINSSNKETIENLVIGSSQESPEEVLEDVYSQLKSQVLVEIIEKIKACTPKFFEGNSKKSRLCSCL